MHSQFPLSRAISFGILAGIAAGIGYIILVVIHVWYGNHGYMVNLGGSAIIESGQPVLELPKFTYYLTGVGGVIRGWLLAHVIHPQRRMNRWLFAPLLGVTMVVAPYIVSILELTIGKSALYLQPFVMYATFGLLFAILTEDRLRFAILVLVCPLTYIIAIATSYLVNAVIPIASMVASLTTYRSDNMLYLHTHESMLQAILWILHGMAMGASIWILDNHRNR